MKDSLCTLCKERSKRNLHRNTLYCEECRLALLVKPKGTMTKRQIEVANRLSGKMDRRDIAKKLGVSLSNLKRSMRDTSFKFHLYTPEEIKKVLGYYEKHGKPKTQKRFPTLSVRSIVERHYGEFRPRQIKWTPAQVQQLAKFAGIISFEHQAKYFNRPRANIGSIKSAWMKKFKHGSGNINGMSEWRAKIFVTEDCPSVKTSFWDTNHKERSYSRRLYLWTDMEKFLKSDCPEFIKEAITAMAGFQRWLYGTESVRSEVMKIQEELSK